MRKANLRSGDRGGLIGLGLGSTDDSGPRLVKRVRVVGFDWASAPRPPWTCWMTRRHPAAHTQRRAQRGVRRILLRDEQGESGTGLSHREFHGEHRDGRSQLRRDALPTDEAFAALPPGTVESLVTNVPALQNILLYHVLGGRESLID